MHTRGQRLLLSLGLLILVAGGASASDPTFLGAPPYGERYFEWKASRGKGSRAPQMVASTCAAPAQAVAPTNIPPVAVLEVQVPAGAEVWVDDHKSHQTGTKQVFRTPELERGKTIQYTVRARWMNDKNLPVEQTQQISVEVGGRLLIDFTRP